MIYSFAGYEVDTDRIEIRRDGTSQHAEPQVFDVLRYLIEHRERVVTKTELLDEIWGGAFVSESALTSRIKSVRQLVGDSGRAQRIIRTVHGRGYQFIADAMERDDEQATIVDSIATVGTRSSGPSGTVSFLFSDIERSSQLWEQHPDRMAGVISRHDELLHGAIASHGGVVFATAGDGVAAAFERATDAVLAARDIRSQLDAETWPQPITLKVRLGVHTGEAVERNDDYLGPAVNRAARVMAAAHGGQTLISDVTARIVSDDDGLVDLGMCQIDPAMPSMRLWQLDGHAFPLLAGAIASALPTTRTELIGRDVDLEQVIDAAIHHRLVSVVGPGGAGKTTLALAAANSVLASFPAGVVFVELASVNDAGGIFRAIAETAGIEGAAAADARTLARHLARRSTLLVLDNCEHLLDECADFVDQVLDAGAEASILTTTREPLGVDGEYVVPLGSLEEHAPELFVARGRAASRDCELRVDDPRIVVMCRQLDGLPLAIELAAAQLQHLGLGELVDRLGESLELSRGGRTRGRERHLTLDRTISWSYDLLDEPGRWLFRQFGVFPGSFDLEAAEAVGHGGDSPATLPVLSDLVAKNLLVRDATTGRYRLLETIRAFASHRLRSAGEAEAAEERLRRHIVGLATARTRVDRWFSGQNAAALRADLDNVRFAFDRSMWTGRNDDALEILIACTYLFRNTMNCVDGRRWIGRLEPIQGFDQVDLLWFTLVQADLAQGTADHELGQVAAARAIELAAVAGDEAALVIARHLDALTHVVSAPQTAQARMDEALELARSYEDARLEHLIDAFSVVVALSAGEVDLGTEISETVGHQVHGDGYEVFISNWAAWTAYLIREDAARLRYWTERQRDYLLRVGVTEPWLFLWSSGLVAAMEGEDATEGLRRARERADNEGHDIDADLVLALALTERLAGRDTLAAELLGVVTGHSLNNLSHYILARTLRSALREQLGADEVSSGMRRGAQRSPNDILRERGLSLS